MIDWAPAAGLPAMEARAELLRGIRDYFYRHAVMEVETPILSAAGLTDPHLQSFRTAQFYLHTSPEFPMKRLLAAGTGSIYQICKVFRLGEEGKRHNPEFTMLEWYRVGYDYQQLMADVASLLAELLQDGAPLAPMEKISYRDAFLQYTGLDPFTSSKAMLMDYLAQTGTDLQSASDLNLQALLDLILVNGIEPKLGRNRFTFLLDYPAAQAALAKLTRNDQGHWVAERFELYWEGVELANGYTELTSADEQRARFVHDNQCRVGLGLDAVPIDEGFLSALAQGLPACAGVALGVDRLLMMKLGKESLAEVLAFPVDRA